MRRAAVFFAMAMCLLLTACGGGEAGASGLETAWTPAELMEAVKQSQEGRLPEGDALTPGEGEFETYLTAYYALDPAEVEDGAIRCASGMSACELAVLRLTEEADMEAVEAALLAYQESRAGDFTGYLPEEAELVETGLTVIQGRWAALLLCPEPEAAREALLAGFGPDAPPPPAVPEEEPAPEAPEPAAPEVPEVPEAVPEIGAEGAPADRPAEIGSPPAASNQAAVPDAPESPAGEYDRSAVAEAWKSGDPSGLSEKSRAVLEAAEAVIHQVITEDMSDYEKELAVHDWMLAWGRYDHETLSHLPGGQAGADSSNPYGFLVDRAGICLGYASTFQLFMDLLDIECMTVEGTAHNGTADHAWNLVRLDGEWYGVDVTWDDPSTKAPISEEAAHRYFNVTSEFLRSSDHQWEADGVPEAEGTAWSWRPEAQESENQPPA